MIRSCGQESSGGVGEKVMNEVGGEGITVKVLGENFLSWLFLPIWEEKICGPGRENNLPGFPLLLFSPACQTVENTVFLSIFLPMFSIPPKFTSTKHSVKVDKTKN